MTNSKNIETHPMKGYWERETRHNRAKADRVRAVIQALSARFTAEPIEAQSSHFKRPGDIGAVAFREFTAADFERPYEPSPTLIEDTHEGMDADGNYHFIPAIKTELNRWQFPDLPPAA